MSDRVSQHHGEAAGRSKSIAYIVKQLQIYLSPRDLFNIDHAYGDLQEQNIVSNLSMQIPELHGPHTLRSSQAPLIGTIERNTTTEITSKTMEKNTMVRGAACSSSDV